MSTNTLSLNYQSKVAIPFGELQSILDWCFRNCEKDWYYKDDNDTLNSYNWTQALLDKTNRYKLDYVFSFESEKDYLAFILIHE